MVDLDQYDADTAITITDGDGTAVDVDIDTDDSNSKKLSVFGKIKGKLGNVISAVQDTYLSIYRFCVDANIRGKTGNVVTSVTDGAKERLHVDAKVSEFELAIGMSQLDDRYRSYVYVGSQTIPNGSDLTLVNLTGPGRFYFIAFGLNASSGVHIKIEIDGTPITISNDVSLPNYQELEVISSDLALSSANTGSLVTFDGSSYKNNFYTFGFQDVGGIYFASTFKVFLQRDTPVNKTVDEYRINYLLE